MPDPHGPSSYGRSGRREPSGRWDHHAEIRDAWGEAPPSQQLPEPHGPAYGPGPSDGLPIRRAGEASEHWEAQPGHYAGGPAGPEPDRPGRHAGPSWRLVMGGAAAAVVLVLVAAAAVFAVNRRAGAAPDASDVAATARATGNAAPDGAYPSSAAPTAEPSQSVSTPAAGKAAATAKTSAPRSTSGVPAPPAGFTLTFAESFDGAAGSGLGLKYRYDTGPGSRFGTGEIETMTDSTRNVFHDGDGHLVIKAVHRGSDPRSGWTSGRFETNSSSFGAAKGGRVRMQASIEQPNVTKANGAGYWPAFWMLGNGLRDGGTWPKIGEVDILEDVNGRSSVFGTLHCGTNPGGPCGESTGIGSGEKACAGCRTGFHTYAVEIDRSSSPEKIRWFLDGRNYFTVSQDRVDDSTWSNAVDHSFFIIFDLAMGGGFPDAFGGGPDDRTVSGGQMKIDYLAVYNSQ